LIVRGGTAVGERPDDIGVAWSNERLVERERAIAGFRGAAADLARAAGCITRCFRDAGKVLAFGNGGSAAQAQHIAGELVGRYAREREGLPAVALAADATVLTGLANDFGFESVFSRQVEALGRPGDVAVAISTSGQSPSTVTGARTARARGLVTVGILGSAGSPLEEHCDVTILTPAPTAARAQELQLVACHIVCELVEHELFPVTGDTTRAPRGVLTVPELLMLRDEWRRAGRSVVWTNGCFDLLHAGHVRMLQAARALGDVLVVGVNDDASVARLKGYGRPIVALADRLEILLALETVDRVVVLETDDPTLLLAQLRPDVHCKGGDYELGDRELPERLTVEEAGGVVRFVEYSEGRSTTAIVDRIRRQQSS
jgi:rfaE bifunctional protein nucleotidyltransferase chain/domain